MNKIEILDYTQNPLTKIGEYASVCYNTKLKDDEHAMRIAKHCLNGGHGRNMEFARVTLKITCSARCAREIYTSIGGSPTRIQESTRYITYDEFDYFTPKFKDDTIEEKYHDLMECIKDFYKLMKDNDIENDVTGYVLPLCMETTFIWSGNIRTLMLMFENRLCLRALKEYRELMIELKRKLAKLDSEWQWIADNFFLSKCIKLGYCPENNKKCPMYKKQIIKGDSK